MGGGKHGYMGPGVEYFGFLLVRSVAAVGILMGAIWSCGHLCRRRPFCAQCMQFPNGDVFCESKTTQTHTYTLRLCNSLDEAMCVWAVQVCRVHIIIHATGGTVSGTLFAFSTCCFLTAYARRIVELL